MPGAVGAFPKNREVCWQVVLRLDLPLWCIVASKFGLLVAAPNFGLMMTHPLLPSCCSWDSALFAHHGQVREEFNRDIQEVYDLR